MRVPHIPKEREREKNEKHIINPNKQYELWHYGCLINECHWDSLYIGKYVCMCLGQWFQKHDGDADGDDDAKDDNGQ